METETVEPCCSTYNLAMGKKIQYNMTPIGILGVRYKK
jgi:hypothetical protein